MKAARHALQRPRDAKLLLVDAQGRLRHERRAALSTLLKPGDLVIANDAATLPASLHGHHETSGAVLEVRLAARDSLAPEAIASVAAVVFGAGDWRLRTEERPPPPLLRPGDGLRFGPLRARVMAVLGHPRLVQLRFDGSPDEVWAGLARHGRPVQYAHLAAPLAMWDVWTRVAAQPVAFEAPSAGFALDWALLDALRARGIGFATLTHAAGLSSTGDAALDARLPLPEPYLLPARTIDAIARTQARGGRVIAIGTTVTRALEDSATRHGGTPRAGEAIATLRLGAGTPLRVVDALLSGTHEPGSSHYELLHAFAPERTLREASAALETQGYRTHEFGDSVLLMRSSSTHVQRATSALHVLA
jgi:S-adenosylmethionine:tRNA ribosyltransferase-isomerase